MFDPNAPFVYFIASGTNSLEQGQKSHNNLLIAVNEINSTEQEASVTRWLADGKNVFIDSGVFNLAMEHARRHHVSHDAGLSMAPDEIDGFAELYDKYIDLIRRVGDQTWGYIEIDQGGRENKIKTRTRLEAEGLTPIPVYHPLMDGWDYFDYLAERYDRICFGNLVAANRATRLRLVATAWQRMRRYPNLWVHLLGLTPNEWLNAFPPSSADSSSWLAAVRWGRGCGERAALKPAGELHKNYLYQSGDTEGIDKAVQLAAHSAALNERNWRNYLSTMRSLGATLHPEEL